VSFPTLTMRIEHCLDRWNQLPREPRHRLSGMSIEVSLQLAELSKLTRILQERTQAFEAELDKEAQKLDQAEA
jgi:hypothetical protein